MSTAVVEHTKNSINSFFKAVYQLSRQLVADAVTFYRQHASWHARGHHGAVALILLASLLVPLYQDWQVASAYALTPAATQLVGTSDPTLTKQLTFDADKQQYIFNQAGQQPVADSQHPLQALMSAQTGGTGKGSTPRYALTIPADLSQGLRYADSNTGLSFRLVPSFSAQAGRQAQGHLVFPLGGADQAIYTLKHNGLKEDIVIPQATSDQLAFTYRLKLPATLQAKTIPGTNDIGIYSADVSLYGNISYGSSSDEASVMQARLTSPKTHLVFGIPAPTIMTEHGLATKAQAHFILKNNTLLVVATGLHSIRGAFSLDPSVVVNSTASFTAGNNEGDIAFGTNQISRGGLTGGAFNNNLSSCPTGWSIDSATSYCTNSTSLPTATQSAASVIYSGYVYEIGGCAGSAFCSATATVDYAPINANGSLGAWVATTSLPAANENATAVSYNGYVYVIGGYDGTNYSATVAYAKLNTTGGLGTQTSCPNSNWTLDANNTWCSSANSTTNLPALTREATSVVYNGYVYEIGGYNGSIIATVDYAPINANGSLGAWVATTSLPAATYEATSVVYNGYVYEIGGCAATCSTATVDYAPINANGSLGAWVATTSLLAATRQATSVVYNGYVYEIGGITATSGTAPGATVDYAPINANGSLGAWVATTNLPTATKQATPAVYNGYVYEIGGYTTGTIATVDYAQIASAGILTPWTTTNGLVNQGTGKGYQGRESNAVVAYGGYIYSLGGNNSGAQYYDESATINSDGSLGTWAQAASLPASYTGIAAVAYSGYMYIFNGCSAIASGSCGAHVTAQAYSSPITSSTGALGGWTSKTAPPTALWGQAAVLSGSYVYLLGGQDSSNAYDTYVYYAQLTGSGGMATNSGCGTTWCTATGFTTGRNFAGAAVMNNYLYIAGGLHATSDTACNATASTYCSDVQYAALTSTGALSSNTCGTSTAWCSTTSMPVTTTGGIFAIKGYLYTPLGYDTLLNSNGTITSWTTTATFATARTNFGSANNGDNIYIVGGDSAGTFDYDAQYTLINNGGSGNVDSWTTDTAAPSPAAVSGAEAVVANGYLYDLGGQNASNQAQNGIYYAPLNRDGSLGAWTTNSVTLPSPLVNFALAVSGNYMFIFGGSSGGNGLTSVYSAPLNATTGAVGSWTTSANSLPAGLTQITAAVANGYVYLAGGNSAGVITNAVYYASLNATTGAVGSWTTSTNTLPIAVAWGSEVAYNNYLYYLGGTTGGTNDVPNVYYANLNASTGAVSTWNTGPPLPSPLEIETAVVYNGFLYVMGGSNAGYSVGGVYVAALLASGGLGNWATVASLPNTVQGASAAVSNGYLYNLNGANLTSGVWSDETAVNYAHMDSIPRISHYSKLIDLGTTKGTVENLSDSGTLPGGLSSISLRTAGSNGLLGSTQAASSFTQASLACVTGTPGTTEYVWLAVTLDDTTDGTFPDTASSDANLTNLTVNYAAGWHPSPNLRLHLGKSFYNHLLQPLDTCIP